MTDAILVTGAAGFIGMHVAEKLLEAGHRVLGIDNLNDYYDPALKEARLERLKPHDSFTFLRCDVADRPAMSRLFAEYPITHAVHLAAQAGVRYSLENPHAYVDANLVGFVNILEGCRHRGVRHLVYASSSSVYGGNTRMPFSEKDNVDHPISLYATTKKANERMAHTYSHLYGLPTTGLRFFTVYGPWGRPDMALFIFTKAILEGRSIPLYNEGRMKRDFTYIDDVAEAVVRCVFKPATPDPTFDPAAPDPATSSAPWRVFNIGNHTPVELERFVMLIEEATGRRAERKLEPMQPGDVPATYADVSRLKTWIGFEPSTPIEEGIPRFVAWYRDFYDV